MNHRTYETPTVDGAVQVDWNSSLAEGLIGWFPYSLGTLTEACTGQEPSRFTGQQEWRDDSDDFGVSFPLRWFNSGGGGTAIYYDNFDEHLGTDLFTVIAYARALNPTIATGVLCSGMAGAFSNAADWYLGRFAQSVSGNWAFRWWVADWTGPWSFDDHDDRWTAWTGTRSSLLPLMTLSRSGQQISSTNSGSGVAFRGGFVVGRHNWSGGPNHFDGGISEIRMWNRVLSEDERATIFDPNFRYDILWQPSNQVLGVVPAAGVVTPTPVVTSWQALTPTILMRVFPATVQTAWQAQGPTPALTVSPTPVQTLWNGLSPGLQLTVQPSPAQTSWVAQTPAIITAGVAAPSPVQTVWNPITPTVSLIVAPTPAQTSWQALTPGIGLSADPFPAQTSWQALTPTIVTMGDVANPVPVVTNWQALTPALLVSQMAMPSPVISAWTALTPTVISGEQVSRRVWISEDRETHWISPDRETHWVSQAGD